MTSRRNASSDTRQSIETTSSPIDRHTTSSTFSSGTNRYSIGSNETGESSTAGSRQSSLMAETLTDGHFDGDEDGEHKVAHSGRGSHRSHKSRGTGGFLLDNSMFEANSTSGPNATAVDSGRQRHSLPDPKGKTTVRSPDKSSRKRKPNTGLGIGGSPLAANVINAGTSNGTADHSRKAAHSEGQKHSGTGLDVDSAQIVNLALNLSESRRNASRRAMSASLPPASMVPSESFASSTGGSLRQHLQQQRRVSRNVSPKPDRGQKAMATVTRVGGQGLGSPLQASFDSQSDGLYQYNPSPSTLARAEKARNAIELMAQYRRLLQYVPPLKAPTLERTATSGSRALTPESPSTSLKAGSSSIKSNLPTSQALGRQYNPLQYIRNRKVRSRNSRAIDGEAQGFGDLEKVSSWVDAITQQASREDYQAAETLSLPPFSRAAGDATSPQASPQSNSGKGHNTPAKIKRPRVDWIVSPADLIADVFWLEQDDNKSIIEDHYGRPVFPRKMDLKRPVSRGEAPAPKRSPPAVKAEDFGMDIRLDTQLPAFKSVKAGSDHVSESTASRARQTFRDVRSSARLHHHGHRGLPRENRHRLRSPSRSESDTSDSDVERRPRRRRSSTAESGDQGADILAKQMKEIFAREGSGASWDHSNESNRPIAISDENQKRASKESMVVPGGSAIHSRSHSLAKQTADSAKGGSSGRASLEVPGDHSRRSLDDLNTTAPSSPVSRATRIKNAFVPSIAMDLSSGRSRHTSPSRRPLSLVSKIRPLYDRSHTSGYLQNEDDPQPASPPPKEDPDSYPEPDDGRRRSMSPIKRIKSKRADDNSPPLRKIGSTRKTKGEESGIRGLFKKSNPVSRVSDLLFKKEAASIGTSSGFSTDDSDIEDVRVKGDSKGSRSSSVSCAQDLLGDAFLEKERSSYILPTFTSPFERRGRTTRTKSNHPVLDLDSSVSDKGAQLGRRLDAPRIDVYNASPTSSPENGRDPRYDRDSSVSDVDSRRGSMSNGVREADVRLNSIIGRPGKRRNALPVTGLSSLGTVRDKRPSLDGRQWSISDRGTSTNRGPMTKREIARVRALLLSSGIKAKEISRRAAELKDLKDSDQSAYTDLATLSKDPPPAVPKAQEHRLAARILSDDIQLSSQLWHNSADTFVNETVSTLISRIASLQHQLVDNLTPMTRTAADEADEVSKDLVTSQTLKVKRISDTIDKMTRRRRRRFRWLRRGGWVLVEWGLVGIMWYVWFMVVIARVVMGVGRGIVGGFRWLFWLD